VDSVWTPFEPCFKSLHEPQTVNRAIDMLVGDEVPRKWRFPRGKRVSGKPSGLGRRTYCVACSFRQGALSAYLWLRARAPVRGKFYL